MKTRIFKTADLTAEELARYAREIEQGALAVVPTDTVYGIGTGAFAEDSIQKIYRLKNRPATSPLQLLTGSMEQACAAAQFSSGAEKLARAFWPGGLTLILPPTDAGKPLLRGFAGLGFRVPGNIFLVELLRKMSVPMACTSANLHGQDVITDEKILIDTFDGKVDFIFGAGVLSPVASSVVDMTGAPRLLREGTIKRRALEDVLGSAVK